MHTNCRPDSALKTHQAPARNYWQNVTVKNLGLFFLYPGYDSDLS